MNVQTKRESENMQQIRKEHWQHTKKIAQLPKPAPNSGVPVFAAVYLRLKLA